MSRFVMSKTPWERCVYPVLKEALEKTNYNQTELAQSLGTSQFTVSAWARGDRDTTVRAAAGAGRPDGDAVPGAVWGMRGTPWKGIAISRFRKRRQRNC